MCEVESIVVQLGATNRAIVQVVVTLNLDVLVLELKNGCRLNGVCEVFAKVVSTTTIEAGVPQGENVPDYLNLLLVVGLDALLVRL